MDSNEKQRFIEDLTATVCGEIINNIPKMPEDWDGIELRQYIADRFAYCIFKGTMGRQRKRKYRNTVLVNNL